MLRFVVSLALFAPAAALACPGSKEMADKPQMEPATFASAALDPTHCAKNASWVGDSCKYSTNLMAQRVHADGADTTLTAKLEPATEPLASDVAAPFRAGDLRVIANAVLEQVDTSSTLSLTGKVLEVDGVKYLLVTSATKSNS